MGIQFFAMPNEQIDWLKDQIKEFGLWCWIRSSRAPGYMSDEIRQIDTTALTTEDFLEFDLGLTTLSQPVFKQYPHGSQLDFPHSQCVQFEPAKLIEKNTLLLGDMGISPSWVYAEVGISDAGIKELYKQLQKSLKSVMSREHLITQVTTSGSVKEWRDMYVTPRAIEFWRQGGLLKQFIAGPVIFGVGERTRKGSK